MNGAAFRLRLENYPARRAAPVRYGAMAAVAHASNFASIVICAFISLDTGHPVFAMVAICWNLSLSVPGILADTVRWLAVISKPSPTFSSVMSTAGYVRQQTDAEREVSIDSSDRSQHGVEQQCALVHRSEAELSCGL